MASRFHYEPMLCPRCKREIQYINEVHINGKMKKCAPQKLAKGAYVYLILDESQNLFKIGYSEDPLQRLKQIAQANTNVLKLIGFIPGSKTNENIIHRKFKNHQVDREWFDPDQNILDYFTYHPNFKEQ